MIKKSKLSKDFTIIHNNINDASIAYKGIFPKDRWKEPYRAKEELQEQINERR